VPLVGENRILVRYGPRKLANSRWWPARLDRDGGLAASRCAGARRVILAPRLNAAGRIGDATTACACCSRRYAGSAKLARELETINARRQEMDHVILDEAIELVDKTLTRATPRSCWHAPGIRGDRDRGVAAVERYGRPTFLVGWDEAGEVGRGSGRSIPASICMRRCTRSCSPREVRRPHDGGGLHDPARQVRRLPRCVPGVAGELLTPDDWRQPAHRSRAAARRGERGAGKADSPSRAVWGGESGAGVRCAECRAVGARRVGTNHLRFTLDDGSGLLPAIGFRGGCGAAGLADEPARCGVPARTGRVAGRTSLQARIASLAPTK